MFQLGAPPLELVARTLIVYVLFFGALRVFGKRELGQFTLFDFALVLLAANAVQPAVTGPDNSVTGGAIIVATIFVANRGLAEARERSALVRRIVEVQPTVIGRDGQWLAEVVRKEGIDDDDLGAALREHGIADVSQMGLATLEEDGSISVVARDDMPGDGSRRRRRRYRRHLP